MAETSTKPYMIRAIHEWCCDNGYTPYLAVKVDGRTLVPNQHVRNGEIVLNISPMATNAMQLGNDLIEFQARFNGVPEYISVPVGNVLAIYARETGSGMAFGPPLEEDMALEDGAPDGGVESSGSPGAPAAAGGEVLAFGRRPAGEKGAPKPSTVSGAPSPAPVEAEPRSVPADESVPAEGSAAAGEDHASDECAGSTATAPASAPPDSTAGPGEDPPPAGGSKPRLVRIK